MNSNVIEFGGDFYSKIKKGLQRIIKLETVARKYGFRNKPKNNGRYEECLVQHHT